MSSLADNNNDNKHVNKTMSSLTDDNSNNNHNHRILFDPKGKKKTFFQSICNTNDMLVAQEQTIDEMTTGLLALPSLIVPANDELLQTNLYVNNATGRNALTEVREYLESIKQQSDAKPSNITRSDLESLTSNFSTKQDSKDDVHSTKQEAKDGVHSSKQETKEESHENKIKFVKPDRKLLSTEQEQARTDLLTALISEREKKYPSLEILKVFKKANPRFCRSINKLNLELFVIDVEVMHAVCLIKASIKVKSYQAYSNRVSHVIPLKYSWDVHNSNSHIYNSVCRQFKKSLNLKSYQDLPNDEATIEAKKRYMATHLPNMTDNEGIVIAAVNSNPLALEYASVRLKDNPEIVLAAVTGDPAALKFASQRLKANTEIVLAAVTGAGEMLKYASTSCRNNEKIVFAAVTSNPAALEFASEELKANTKIVEQAVCGAGKMLKYASASCRNNRNIVEIATKNDPWSLCHASEQLQTSIKINYDEDEPPQTFEEFILCSLKEEGENLSRCSEKMKADKKYVMASLPGGLEFASEGEKRVLL